MENDELNIDEQLTWTDTVTTTAGNDLYSSNGVLTTPNTSDNWSITTSSNGGYSWDGNMGPIADDLREVDKGEFKKVTGDKEIFLMVSGELKRCRLSDLLDTTYLKLKML